MALNQIFGLGGMPLQFTMRNTDGVIRNLYAKQADILEEIKDATEETAAFEQQLISDNSPVDTGFMRDHVEVAFTPDHLYYDVGWFAETFTAAGLRFYPPYQEFPTSTTTGRPILHPAHRVVEHQYKAAISAAIHRAVEFRRRVA